MIRVTFVVATFFSSAIYAAAHRTKEPDHLDEWSAHRIEEPGHVIDWHESGRSGTIYYNTDVSKGAVFKYPLSIPFNNPTFNERVNLNRFEGEIGSKLLSTRVWTRSTKIRRFMDDHVLSLWAQFLYQSLAQVKLAIDDLEYMHNKGLLPDKHTFNRKEKDFGLNKKFAIKYLEHAKIDKVKKEKSEWRVVRYGAVILFSNWKTQEREVAYLKIGMESSGSLEELIPTLELYKLDN